MRKKRRKRVRKEAGGEGSAEKERGENIAAKWGRKREKEV